MTALFRNNFLKQQQPKEPDKPDDGTNADNGAATSPESKPTGSFSIFTRRTNTVTEDAPAGSSSVNTDGTNTDTQADTTSPGNTEETTEQDLDALEAQLRASLKEIEAKRQAIAHAHELARLAELAKQPVKITVTDFYAGWLTLTSNQMERIVQYILQVGGRQQYGAGGYGILFTKWDAFNTLLNENGIIPEYADPKGVIKRLTGPDVSITHEKKFFKLTYNDLKHGSRVPLRAKDGSTLADIPGVLYYQRDRSYQVPLTEAWRLYELCENAVEIIIVYGEGVKEAIAKAAELRIALQQYQTAEDAELDLQLRNLVFKPNQKVGIRFAEATNYRTLISYDMGMGKTCMSIGCVELSKAKRIVVICPASLKLNWYKHIENLTGEQAYTCMGAEPNAFQMKELLIDKPRFVIINFDILARKSEVEVAEGATQERFFWSEMINSYNPDMVIIDEAHYIKNPSSNRSKALRKLTPEKIIALTGTPILNRPGELWPILTMLYPETFPSYETFLRQYTYDGRRARNVEQLRSLLSTIMIRRTQDLKDINNITEWHEISDKARELYRKAMQGVYEAVAAYSAKGESYTQEISNILVQINRCKQICAMDKVDHTAELAITASESTEETPHNKVLIFSQYKAVAYAIYSRLREDGALCFVERGGDEFHTVNDEERFKRVQEFQTNPDIKFLIVTEKTAREGLDITKAGTVIFNDLFWTPAGHMQAEGRAFGRASDFHGGNSYSLVASGTIEEWIIELLNEKRSTINQVIDGEGNGGDSNITKELIEKLKNNWGKM